MMSPYEDDEGEEWPKFLPIREDYRIRIEEQYALEEEAALPHKERGNKAYQARKFEEALMHYTKALHVFSIDSVALDKTHSFLLGTIANGCSPVQILGNVGFQLQTRIASYLCPPVYFAHRLPAVIYGNISIVLRALKRPGAWDAARRSLFMDPTYAKALSLMEKAVVDSHSPIQKEIQSQLAANYKMNEKLVTYMGRSCPSHIGIMATGMLPDPWEFAILEQSRAHKELDAIMSSEAYLNYRFEPSPKNVLLGLSLVPFQGACKTEGQWLVMNLSFLDTSEQFLDHPIEIPKDVIPDLSHFHFARADPENGDDAEAPPSGKASPRAVAFVLERVPLVAQTLLERWGLTVKQVRCGQALVNLTGPNGPDESNEIGMGPAGFPVTLPSVEAREEPARKFREMDLGEDSERLWGLWDDFARNIKVLPAHSTYAEEKATGFGATRADVPSFT